jgi:hypothetical protein
MYWRAWVVGAVVMAAESFAEYSPRWRFGFFIAFAMAAVIGAAAETIKDQAGQDRPRGF